VTAPAHDLARRLWAGQLGHGGSVLRLVLAPAEAAYRGAVRARGLAYDHGLLSVSRADVPVISVGNIAIGGTGKTPFTNWLARHLQARGRRPAILHGGYAGDEPMLHRKWAPSIPVVVGRHRVAGAARAVEEGADVIVLDDGFQHRRLHRDLDLVLLAAERWASPLRVLPRGPWREPISALHRADMVIVTRKTASLETRDTVLRELDAQGLRTAAVHLRPSGWCAAGSFASEAAVATSGALTAEAAAAPAEPVLLVCAVAEPALVADSARAMGADVASVLAFGDHHDYSEADARRIIEAAAGRPIISTEKDWVKLELLLNRVPVWLLTQEVVVEHGAGRLEALLTRTLS
jgi:tetraacyldisaccharide 4'-kinase